MYTVYVLISKKDGELYTGYSKDFDNRFAEHENGNVPATRDRRPLEVIFREEFINRKDAMRREKFLKTGWGRNQLNKILENTLKQ